MPMVFISHSSEPGAVPVREEVQHQLEERGWEVRVDVDALRGGDEWKSVLYNWLADCDAAVVIIGHNAIESPWVRREVNLLLWRYALGSPLTIVPVLLPDISSYDVKNSDLSEVLAFQFVKRSSENLAEDDVGELASRVVRTLPDISGSLLSSPDRDDMHRWLLDVVSCLREVDDETALRAAVRALNVADDWHFPSIQEGRRFLAYQMLAPDLAGCLHKAVIAIARQASTQLAQLVQLVTPAWVAGEAARLLLPHGRKVFAFLNARRSETATHYVQRAACCSLNYRTQAVTLILGEEQRLEFMHACEVAVRRLLDLPADYSLEGEEPLDGEVGFLVVDPDNTPIDVAVDTLRPLLSRFEWLNVILLTGESCPDQALIAQWGLGGVMLRPELVATEERDAARTVQRLRDLQRELARR